ncbi:MAG: S-methyl-5'-thioadenosine phosphorylase, partial [Candidatus Bathyarchaeota archaeon]
MNRARIGIICGVGLEELHPEGTDLRVGTPFGSPPIMRLASLGDVDVVFLTRRGSRHNQPPHLTNYRANIYGLHELGVER